MILKEDENPIIIQSYEKEPNIKISPKKIQNNNISELKKKKKAISLHSKPKSLKENSSLVPGPGFYNIESSKYCINAPKIS